MTGVGDDEVYRQYETVSVYRRGAGAKLELNRPERMNAWNDQFAADLLAAIRAVTDDPEIRAVAVTGAGRAFSSGFDLKEAAERADGGPVEVYRALTERFHPLITGLRLMPKPVLAVVHGTAAGIGLSLALACDLVVAAESAFFQLAFVNVGLVPDGGSSLFVPSRVGFARAAELAMLGERLDATSARDWGLINRVWPDAEFATQADALLDRLASGPTRSYAGTKRQLNRWLYEQMDAQLEFEAGIQRELATSGDFAEGLAGFLDKRPPRFGGA
jgi:2-(1,2-epoxy-1,2-dihydrophenyl)acetyl-CoA isomerase